MGGFGRRDAGDTCRGGGWVGSAPRTPSVVYACETHPDPSSLHETFAPSVVNNIIDTDEQGDASRDGVIDKCSSDDVMVELEWDKVNSCIPP